MKPIEAPGRCRCERAGFVLREEPIAFYLCHCTRCQAESGSAFGQSMLVRREAVTEVTGPVREHGCEGPAGEVFVLSHCGNCLTVLWGSQPEMPQVCGLNAGCLEDTGGLTPYGNMWTRSARPWAAFAPGPRYEKHPEGPLAMIHAWQGRPGAADGRSEA